MRLPNQKDNRSKFDNFIKYSSLGFEMAAIIAFGTWGGFKIDQWMENDFKFCTLILMIFSVTVSIIYGIRSLLKK